MTKKEHTWKPACIYIYIKPLRPDPTRVKHTQSNSWVCLTIPWDQVFKELNSLDIYIYIYICIYIYTFNVVLVELNL